ncbi:hypothetical protein JavanS250_0003 [Streptococcus satellite phage Javan250]|uniref:hypothetical protein n=1 Tax=Streptococcus halotolerans TaxID=1814128 RepID=UPI0007868923|nr:hypothetical protein [Streptococcus halotolerans]QBX08336.1 hypothetical protein JavanS250_0003 [Streptococcus satellite phage Javan250]
MTTLKDIQTGVDGLKQSFELFSVYDKKIADIDDEIEELEKTNGASRPMRIGRLTKKRQEMISEANGYTIDYYHDLFNEAYDINVHSYIDSELANDKELIDSREQYHEAKEELLDILVSHNRLVKNKLNKLINQVRATGYSDIIEKVADNNTAKILGMRRPSDRTKNYFNQSSYIEVPLGFHDEYSKRMKSKHKGKKKSKSSKKTKLFSFR